METTRISIERLMLDVNNPRIPKAESQRDALQRILDDQQSGLAVLAEDIKKNGLNPMDRWLVLPADDQGNFVVVEGNRRLAAIKLLSNPAVLGDLNVSLSGPVAKSVVGQRRPKEAPRADIRDPPGIDGRGRAPSAALPRRAPNRRVLWSAPR